MEYKFDTNDRPFKAILAGTKKVEGRTQTELDETPYEKFKTGDIAVIINNSTNETLKAKIVFVHHYSNIKKMLEKEGPENVLSSEPKTVEQGIESFNSLHGYEEGMKRNGIYAIGLELIQN